LKHRLSRRWLFLLCVLLLAGLVFPLSRALAQDSQPGDPVCPPNCPVSFGLASIFAPASNEASSIITLYNFIFVMAGIIFVLVEGALLFTVLRFRNRPPEMAEQFHGNTKLEIVWTAAPAVILAVLMGFTLRTMGEVRAVGGSGNVVQVKAIGHQWWWEFRYPGLDPEVITANELVVPVGSTIEVAIESVDVEHGFWAPELFGKVDAIPGYTTRVKFTPTSTGAYVGQCTQYCGTQHAQMRFGVVVLSASDYQAWAANEQRPAAAATGHAVAGEAYFLGEGLCKACHALNGTAAVGVIGPNLTHLASRRFIAGGVLENTPENLRLWLRNPQAVKEGNKMKIPPLDEQTIHNLVTYLSTLK